VEFLYSENFKTQLPAKLSDNSDRIEQNSV
jgi:hypothetical protein